MVDSQRLALLDPLGGEAHQCRRWRTKMKIDRNSPAGSFCTGMTLEQRFLSKIDKQAHCWIWRGACHGKGYGHFRLYGRVEKAHRAAWLIYMGEILDGLQVLHDCDMPACVNPHHLFLGTNQDNLEDRQKKQRQARGESHSRAKLTEA